MLNFLQNVRTAPDHYELWRAPATSRMLRMSQHDGWSVQSHRVALPRWWMCTFWILAEVLDAPPLLLEGSYYSANGFHLLSSLDSRRKYVAWAVTGNELWLLAARIRIQSTLDSFLLVLFFSRRE